MSDFDKIFKQKFENFTETPPADVFANLQKSYPKQTFKEFVLTNKYYFVAGIAVIAVVATVLIVSLPKHDNQSNPKQIHTTTETPCPPLSNSTEAELTLNFKSNKVPSENINSNDIENNLVANSDDKSVKFICHDTTVCGNNLYIAGINIENIITSNKLILSKVGQGVNFYSENPGTFAIYHKTAKLPTDSLLVTFKNENPIETSISKTDICPGEKIVVSANGNIPNALWNLDNHSVRKLSGSEYEISNLPSGKHIVELSYGSDGCISRNVFEVSVADLPEYNISVVPEYCGQKNGELLLKSESDNINYYKLGGIISNSGTFENLKNGTYKLEVNYANSCVKSETIIVHHENKIKANFDADEDAFDAMNYIFRNETAVVGVSDVSFEWFINGVSKSTDYNLEYKFASGGNYNIELVAVAEGCRSSYSKTINIASTKFSVPNIFTPNGDGIGDLFEIRSNGEYHNYELSVFTQSGQLIFSTNNPDKYWDGKMSGNNEAAEGIYFYVISALDTNGENITQKGTVQLKRK